MRTEDDRDLEVVFRALRESDAARAPSLGRILERPVAPPRSVAVARAAGLAIAFVGLLAASALVVSRARAPRPAPADLWAWSSPTRSLLPRGAPAPVPRVGETWGSPSSESQEVPK